MMLLGYTFKDIERIRFSGQAGCISKFIIRKNGKVVVNFLNQSY